jgi:indole-3-glycerol phosphate synthase
LCHSPTFSLRESLQQKPFGIIAEFKRRSPSKGLINGNASPTEVALGYEQAGVAAISVLTDTTFFGGTPDDLAEVRKAVRIPVLRKDFTVDTYQITEAKAWGADVVLLIAAALEPMHLQDLAAFAKDIGLEVLLEVHSEEELDSHFCDEVDVVGVNNRNLKTFEVNIDTSLALLPLLPTDRPCISESGITNPLTLNMLKKAGYQGFLIGESFMRQALPAVACKEFMAELRKLA